MYLIERVTKVPATGIRIMIDEPEEGSPDAGFTRGGSFNFFPGDEAVPVGDTAAAAIMEDPVYGHHFKSTPAWTKKAAAKVADETVKAEKGAEKAAEKGKASK